jgi:acyl carrier protein
MHTTQAELQTILGEIFEVDGTTLDLQTVAEDVERWDSLNHLNIVATMEERYGVALSADEMASMLSIGAIVELLRAHGVAVEWSS